MDIDIAEGDGVMDTWVAEVERSLVACCRTGFVAGVGVAIGFIFGMLFEVGFSTWNENFAQRIFLAKTITCPRSDVVSTRRVFVSDSIN